MTCYKYNKFVRERRGVADVLAVAIMFLLVVLVGVLLHTFMLTPLRSATDRQLQLKSEYIYETLATAWVEPYSKSYLRAAADNLVFTEPTIPSDYLSSAMENVLKYLVPQGYAVEVTLTYGDNSNTWRLQPKSTGKQFIHSGKISVIRAEPEVGENRTILVQATLTLFWGG
jgi:hypothetical protein